MKTDNGKKFLTEFMKFQNELVLELESLKRELPERLGKDGEKQEKRKYRQLAT